MGDSRNTARLGTGWFGGPRKVRRSGMSRRRRHELRPAPESLEGRTLLSLGLDPTWGFGGLAQLNLPQNTATASYSESIGSIAMQNQQVVESLTLTTNPFSSGGSQPSTDQMLVTRLNTGGFVDGTFGTGGTTAIPMTTGGATYNMTADDIAVQSSGTIDVLGYATPTTASLTANPKLTSALVVAQLTPTGALDSSFGTSGVALVTFGANSSINFGSPKIAIAPNGKIDIATTVSTTTTTSGGSSTTQSFGVARLNSNGSLDTTFNGTGLQTVTFPKSVSFPTATSIDATTSALTVLPSGGVVVVGYTQPGSSSPSSPNLSVAITDTAVAQLTPGGQLDPTFNGTGLLTFNFNLGGSASGDIPSAVALEGTSIVIVGTSGQPFTVTTNSNGNRGFTPNVNELTVARLNPNGTFDTTFNGTGKYLLSLSQSGTTFNTAGKTVVARPSGDLVIGGTAREQNGGQSYYNYGGGPRGGLLISLTPSGTLDPAFGNGGAAIIPNNVDNTLLQQSDGKFVFVTGNNVGRTTAPPPVVVSTNVITVGKGKRARAVGLTITFNTPANTMLANNANAYVVLPMRGRRPIRIRKRGGVSYDPTTDTLTLRFVGRVRAMPGFRVLVRPSGIIGAAGYVLFDGQPMPIIVRPSATTS